MKCLEMSMQYFVSCNLESFNTDSRLPFDLQLFSGEKTEDATPKRRRDARQKGQVGKSQEINSAFIILSAFMALKVLGAHMYGQIADYMVYIYTNMSSEIADGISIEFVMNLFIGIIGVFAKTALPVMLSIMVIAVVANLFQVGFNFTTKPLMPSLGKLNPIAGAKKMVSKRALVELFKSIFKIIVVGYFIVRFLKQEVMYLPNLIYMDLMTAMRFVSNLILNLAFQICGVLIVLAILDYCYQKWDHSQSIKMSKQEVKDEFKQSEGDPHIKSKIKQKQRAMAMQRMMQEVPKADVVVTNPTHFAIALKYEKGMGAPMVIAKGQDLIAQRIKAIAKEAQVVIVENKPLARALYAATEVGDFVPQELYKSVAEVLAYVYRLKKKLS